MCLSLIDWLVQERKLVDCYLLSHEAPPDHKWPAPICCRVCGFTACCDADVRKDAEELGLMSDVKRRQWQAEHEGNVPHQSPVLAIDVLNCLPPIYHHSENLIDYWWKHTIWDETAAYEKRKMNEMRYDVNVVLKEHIGYCHVPPKRGDDCFCMSWIGKDCNNLRASAALPLMLHKVWPDEMKAGLKLFSGCATAAADHDDDANDGGAATAATPTPPPDQNLSAEEAALRAAAEDSDDEEAAAGAADEAVALLNSTTNEDVVLSDVPRPHLVALAADARFELIDMVSTW